MLLAGDIDIRPASTSRCVASTCSTAPATAVYLPPGSSIEVAPTRAPSSRSRRPSAASCTRRPAPTPALVEPADVVVHDRGRPGWQREVHDIIADTVPAQRLLVGETFNAAGRVVVVPAAQARRRRRRARARRGVLLPLRSAATASASKVSTKPATATAERAVFLRHGSVVGIPRGYHPVCAAPGYRLYYLWALGPRRRHRPRARAARRPRAPLAARAPGRLTRH